MCSLHSSPDACVSGQLVSCQIRLPRAYRSNTWTQLAGCFVYHYQHNLAAWFHKVAAICCHVCPSWQFEATWTHLITRGISRAKCDLGMPNCIGNACKWEAWQQGDCRCRVGQVGPHAWALVLGETLIHVPKENQWLSSSPKLLANWPYIHYWRPTWNL